MPEGEVGDNLPPENGISIWGWGQIELRCSYIMALASPSHTHTLIQWDERAQTWTDMSSVSEDGGGVKEKVKNIFQIKVYNKFKDRKKRQ